MMKLLHLTSPILWIGSLLAQPAVPPTALRWPVFIICTDLHLLPHLALAITSIVPTSQSTFFRLALFPRAVLSRFFQLRIQRRRVLLRCTLARAARVSLAFQPTVHARLTSMDISSGLHVL